MQGCLDGKYLSILLLTCNMICQCLFFSSSQLISFGFLFIINYIDQNENRQVLLQLMRSYVETRLFQSIYFIMSQYLNQFVPSAKPSENLEHYRIEIRKLQQKLKQTTTDYEKRIKDLENQLKHHRKPIFQNTTSSKPTVDLNFEIYQRDNAIKELKNQNTKLRQIINNPDHILIKKQNNFELLTEKDNEINRLKKALIDIQSKYDGQFFNQHKVKKQYEMLCKQNESLKLHIRNLEPQRRSFDQELMSNEVIQTINYKKQLQTAIKENQVLRRVIMDQEQVAKTYSRVSQKPFQESIVRKYSVLAFNTQVEEMKLQIEEYKAKNRELQKNVNDLSKQNEFLLTDKEKMTKFTSRESKRIENPRMSKAKEGPQEEELIKYYQNNEALRASFAEDNNKIDQTPKKFGKYYELGIDSYASRLSKVEKPLIKL